MRIEQLQAFLAIAQTGNFGQAAKLCGITQSTISRQIQSLEAELGIEVFHRTAQAKLTVAGECLLPRARKICQEWQNAQTEVADLLAGKQPELCVAAIHSVCAYYLPPILQQFCRLYPHVQLRVTALGSDRALKVLRDGLVDVALVMNNPRLTTSPEMEMQSLYEEPIEVLMSASHPLANCREVAWEKLIDYPQVIFKDGYGMQRVVNDWFRDRGHSLKVALELNTLDGFRGVVRQGDMLALLPQSALLESKHDPTLAVRPLAVHPHLPSLNREVVMITTCDRVQFPPIYDFCQLVSQFAQSASTSPPLTAPQANPSLLKATKV